MNREMYEGCLRPDPVCCLLVWLLLGGMRQGESIAGCQREHMSPLSAWGGQEGQSRFCLKWRKLWFAQMKEVGVTVLNPCSLNGRGPGVMSPQPRPRAGEHDLDTLSGLQSWLYQLWDLGQVTKPLFASYSSSVGEDHSTPTHGVVLKAWDNFCFFSFHELECEVLRSVPNQCDFVATAARNTWLQKVAWQSIPSSSYPPLAPNTPPLLSHLCQF